MEEEENTCFPKHNATPMPVKPFFCCSIPISQVEINEDKENRGVNVYRPPVVNGGPKKKRKLGEVQNAVDIVQINKKRRQNSQ
jgi:hypothetical protein